MKTFFYAVLGFLVASFLAWGGLLIWAFTVLDPNDSYWDRTPNAADTFVACWLIFGIATAIGSVLLSRRRDLKHNGQLRRKK